MYLIDQREFHPRALSDQDAESMVKAIDVQAYPTKKLETVHEVLGSGHVFGTFLPRTVSQLHGHMRRSNEKFQ
jgi:hypothetical protein